MHGVCSAGLRNPLLVIQFFFFKLIKQRSVRFLSKALIAFAINASNQENRISKLVCPLPSFGNLLTIFFWYRSCEKKTSIGFFFTSLTNFPTMVFDYYSKQQHSIRSNIRGTYITNIYAEFYIFSLSVKKTMFSVLPRHFPASSLFYLFSTFLLKK